MIGKVIVFSYVFRVGKVFNRFKIRLCLLDFFWLFLLLNFIEKISWERFYNLGFNGSWGFVCKFIGF